MGIPVLIQEAVGASIILTIKQKHDINNKDPSKLRDFFDWRYNDRRTTPNTFAQAIHREALLSTKIEAAAFISIVLGNSLSQVPLIFFVFVIHLRCLFVVINQD